MVQKRNLGENLALNLRSKVNGIMESETISKTKLMSVKGTDVKLFKMKKLFILVVILFTFQMFGKAQRGNYPNPAAAYCELLGYKYQVDQDSNGNQKGVCILPDSSKVDAWDFYRGKVKKEYSYCERNGYSMETKIVQKNGFTVECPYCVGDSNIKGKNFEEIPMLELMDMNGDTLIINRTKRQNIQLNGNEEDTLSILKPRGLPTSFDWRNYNGHAYIGSIRDQGSCGSCYAFGAVACAEGVFNKAFGLYDTKRKEFSESFIMWCLGGLSKYNTHFYGCDGADYDYKELEALTDEGVCERSYFPYRTTDPGSCTHWNDPKGIFSSWQRVSCNDINAIKTAIIDYGVVDAAVYVTTDFQNYTGDIYIDANTSCSGSPCSYTATNHAIALVGWGYDATHGDYWILRNSWGSSWGESGYMRIKATSARVACAVSYLVPNPVTYKATSISLSNKIPTGSNVKCISDDVTLDIGFEVELGAEFEIVNP